MNRGCDAVLRLFSVCRSNSRHASVLVSWWGDPPVTGVYTGALVTDAGAITISIELTQDGDQVTGYMYVQLGRDIDLQRLSRTYRPPVIELYGEEDAEGQAPIRMQVHDGGAVIVPAGYGLYEGVDLRRKDGA